MKLINNPNLPDREVRTAIIDARAKEEIEELIRNGISVIPTKEVSILEKSVAYHPDMQICHLGTESFYVLAEAADYYKNMFRRHNIDCYFFNNINSLVEQSSGKLTYPKDCRLNSALTSEWVITHTDNDLYDKINRKVIKTRQGYVKCSTCIVDTDAIITADPSIAKAATSNGIDVCVITNEGIILDGYKNGFIGGCCGKISKEVLAFFGNINLHKDCDEIKSFCRNHQVYCESLSNNALYDYGSLLPIV